MSDYIDLIAPEFALHWANKLGFEESSLMQLTGGINNQVYRCGRGQYCVIKGYGAIKPGQRDRMQAEVDFLKYASQVAPHYCPALIHVDHYRRCIVMEYLEGKKFANRSPAPEFAVACAVDFFYLLNSDQTTTKGLIGQDAAEGFLKLTEHLENIKDRLARMEIEHLPAATKKQAKKLLDALHERYQRICESVAIYIRKGRLIDSIGLDDRCISPSDFGFHNAMETISGVKFIDFEFAGWDDPGKAIIDFILQPRVPVNQTMSPLLASLNSRQKEIVNQRYIGLLPILHLKWSCIILSVFNPKRLGEIIQKSPGGELEGIVYERMIDEATHCRKLPLERLGYFG